MKKIKKLVIHSSVIVVLLFVFYYFGGYYISKEECIRDILRSYYAKETNIIMEIGNGKHSSVTVIADKKNKSRSFVETKKIGFLYRVDSCSISKKIDTREKLDFSVFANNSMGAIIFLYRNDTSIDRVEVIMTDGTSIILDEWHDNFTGYYINFDKWRSNTYKAYNTSNQLIYEKEY